MKYINIIVTNCCYYRGGSKVPFRIRKFQNVSWSISKERLEKFTNNELLNYLNGRMVMNGSPVWTTSSSKIKKQ